MKGDSLSSRMLAWRKLLGGSPALREAIAQEWDRWTLWQRTQPPDVSKPQLVIIADLSCTEDLEAHLGLAQLLAHPDIRCTVVLAFPTEALAQIALGEGRRAAWHGLVHIAGPSERARLLKSLPADSPLALFPGPAVLSLQCLEAMIVISKRNALLSQRRSEGLDYPRIIWGHAFLGRAGDYRGFQQAEDQSSDEPAMTASQLLALEPVELGLSGGDAVPPARNQWPKASWSIDPPTANGNAIGLPRVESGDELVIRLNRNPLPSTVVERRSARLCAPDRPLNIRLAGEMLAPAPKLVRLESYKINGRVEATNLLLRIPPSQLQPWMISAFLNRGGGGNPVVRAFAQGIGCRLAYAEDEPDRLSEIPVVWGVLRESDRILAQAKARSMYFFYIDHAYFDRGHGKSYRITRNRYEAGPVRECPTDRLDKLDVEVRPWRKSGRDIIVCPPTDYFMAAHGCADWLETTLEALGKLTDRPIVVREKPKPGEAAVPLKTALKTAHALVTHSSNVAIEAACLGTPVFVNPASAAAPIGETDLAKIETPSYPDRDPWLAHLAYNQFSLDEIREGEAWRLLLELEEREFV